MTARQFQRTRSGFILNGYDEHSDDHGRGVFQRTRSGFILNGCGLTAVMGTPRLFQRTRSGFILNGHPGEPVRDVHRVSTNPFRFHPER